MSGLFTGIGILFIRLVSYLPFWCIYIISDIFYFFVYYVFKYRKNVVFLNLKNSFPEKDEKDLLQISKKFYHHFCDTMFEAIKHFSITNDSFNRRVDLSDVELINDFFEKGKSIILLSFHYGNWEWSKFIAVVSKHINLYVYNPQRNKKFDVYFKQFRAKFGGFPIPTSSIYKEMLKYKKQNKLTLTWLGADQTPVLNTKFWTLFLNQETPFFPGPGRLAIKTNQVVLFQYMKKTSRGKYKCIIEPLIADPSQYSESEVLKIYANRIEKIIKEKPQYYLWSHRRWKHKRPSEMPLFVE
jgi:KDO2-lipid IV(A) lauroyltransferase